ncbi:MAG: substrate-binding domain-containing protein [Elstera sp.]
MKMPISCLLLPLLLLAEPLSAQGVALNGSTTVIKLVLEASKVKIEQESGQKLTIVGNGSQRGVADLAAGKADIAMISTALADILAAMGQAGAAVSAADYKEHPLAPTEIAFAVHPSNPLASLTVDQMVQVLKGTAKSWTDVGGAAVPVIVVSEQKGGGIRTIVETELLAKAELGATLRELPGALQVTKVTAQIPGALGLVSLKTLDASVKPLTIPKKLVQNLSLVTKGEPSPAAKAVITAMQKAAQE